MASFKASFRALFASEQPGHSAVNPCGLIVGPKREGLIKCRDCLIPSLAPNVGQPRAIVGFGQHPARVQRVLKRLLRIRHITRKQIGIPLRGAPHQIVAIFFEEGVDHL